METAIQVKNILEAVYCMCVFINSGQPAVGNETAASNESLCSGELYHDERSCVESMQARIEQGTDFIAEVSIWNPGVRGQI
jgi:hypothetical protein